MTFGHASQSLNDTSTLGETMALVNIDTVGRVGVARDERDYRLDPAVWSTLNNARPFEGEIVSMGGKQTAFGSIILANAPQFLTPVRTANQTFWVWTSNAAAFVEESGLRSIITRSAGNGGAYTASHAKQWNSTFIGGILVLNNGVDLPQYWSSPASVTKLENLVNWPSAHRAKVIRTLGPFMVAVHMTLSASVKPHMVRWSDAADPGSLPSWDVTDATKKAGFVELSDIDSGVLQDAMPLRGQLYLYKDTSTWRMRIVGGFDVMAFDSVFETAGVLATRCVGATGDGMHHFVATQDDIVVHNGTSAESVVHKRLRRAVFSQLDTDKYDNSFVFANQPAKEMWFCWPEEGNESPNRAVCWNWKDGTLTEADVNFVAAAPGPFAGADETTWADEEGTWSSGGADEPWSKIYRRRVLVAMPSIPRIAVLEETNTEYDDSTIHVQVQRTGLAIIGQKRDGTPIVDFNVRKMCTRVWPRMTGGPVRIRMGSQETVGGPVSWTGFYEFDPTTEEYLDLIVEGASLAIEFSSKDDVSWTLEGYKLEISTTGSF